jgi:hypothetical protein
MMTFAQIGGEDEVYLSGDRVEAKFRGGGIEKFSEFVQQEFNYSKVTKPGSMIASFTVDVDGSVKNIKLVKMLDVDSATEMFRVLNKCPKWEPAKRGGKPISIDIKYPMSFNVKPSTNPSKPAPEQPSDNVASDVLRSENVQIKPRYPGGIIALQKYVTQNFKSTEAKGTIEKITVSFIIETDGSLSDIKTGKDLGSSINNEMIRVLSSAPKWIPGKQAGKPVRVAYTLPLNIQL